MSAAIQESVVLPDGMRHLTGQLVDVDSHEMMPAQVWTRECGAIAGPLAEAWLSMGTDVKDDINHPNVPGYWNDDAAIDVKTIWSRKGAQAPGAVDVRRRDGIMDAMGVRRQLMFPTGVGMYGVFMASLDENYGHLKHMKDVGDRKQYGIDLIKAYNRWGMSVANVSSRVRPVLPLFGDTVEALMTNARELVDAGIRAVWLPSNWLPGGKSPAHYDLDGFWSYMTANEITVALHVGTESKIYGDDAWGEAPVFDGFRMFAEFKIDPWSRVNSHITSQNFVSTMVLGGVFDRHPNLRFGIIELGAYWIGQLCEVMDLWYKTVGILKGSEHCYRLPRKPSDYVKSNVRVSPYDFEDIDVYITRYGLEDVLCFASDYPHVEGGRDPIGTWYKLLKPLGDRVVEKFFVTNGKWLLPD
jgi:hypothetical protein